MHSILIADDHPVVILGIKFFLEQKGYNIAGICNNGIEAFNQIITKRPSLALLDINMPGMTGLEITEKLNDQKNRTKIILLTGQNELSTFNYAKGLNVKGFLLKEFAINEIEKCLHEVVSGGTYFSTHLSNSLFVDNKSENTGDIDLLTFTEKKILNLVAEQKSTREIANLLFISIKTVETHRSHIIKKLNLPRGKNVLLMWAIKRQQ